MALKDLLTDLSKFKYTNYENVGANNSQVEGRHGGYKGKGQPPHPEAHSKFDDKSGINLSKISGRHGGFEGKGQPPHPEAHSKFDDGVGGIGNPQSFTVRGYTVSDIISGRHGGTVGPTPAQPPHPDDHSEFDNGVGFGVYPSDNPQSFDVRGYTITGTKTFDRPNQDAITIMTNRVGFPYTPFESGVKTGPVDFFSGVKSSWGDGTLPLGFSFNMVDSLLSPGTPPVLSLNTLRHTIPEVGPSPEFTFSNIPKLADAHSIDSLSRLTGYNGIYIESQGGLNQTVGAPSISSNGITFTGIDGAFNHTLMRDRLYKHYQNHFLTQPYTHITLGSDLFDETGDTQPWKDGSIHIGSQDLKSPIGDSNLSSYDFMSRLGYDTYQSGVRLYNATDDTYGTTGTTVTHNVSMITLSGPTIQAYHTTLNTSPISSGAHGTGTNLIPTNWETGTESVEAYSSIFATQDELLMDSIFDSGFNRGGMYMNHSPEPSTPTFKDFTQSDKSLKPSSEWDPQKYGSNFVDTQYTFFGGEKKEFRFDDRIPYNIPARDNNVIGFDQPFILKDIGDRWGPGGLGAIDEGLFRGGFVTSAARTVADVFRLGKFILTPTGIMFGLKQAGLQLLNPRAETRIWNPLSLGSVAPMVHVDRHLGGGTYEDAIGVGGEESILTGYGNAVTSLPAIQGGKIAFQTARRVTLAHTAAMVPGAGGKVSFGALPEIGFDLLAGGSGNINSFSKNIVGTNIYRAEDSIGNKEYPVTKGATPLISGIKLDGPTWGVSLLKKVTGFDVGDQGEYTGRSYAQLDEPILYDVNPFKTIKRVDGGFSVTLGHGSVINGIPEGNIYDAGEDTAPYQKSHNKNKLIPITGEQYGSGPGYGLANRATLYTITEKYDGTQTIATFGEELPLALTSVLKTGIFQGNLYEKGSEYFSKHHSLIEASKVLTISLGEGGHLGPAHYITGEKYPQAKPTQFYKISTDTFAPQEYKIFATDGARNAGVAITRGDRIFKTGIFQGDLYKKDSEYFPEHSSNVPVDKPLYLGHAGTGGVNVHTTQIYGKNDIPPGTAKERTTDFDHESDGKESKVFTISTHSGKNFYKKGTLYLSGHGTLTPTGKLADDQAGFSIGKRVGDSTFTTKVTAYSETNKEPISISDGTFPNFSGDLYDKDNKYRSQISSFGIVSSPPTLTRLRTHADTGDPTVTIKTSHPESDPNVPRLSAEGKYKDGLKDIKLQDFPLINLTGDGNLGTERQSLGFVNKTLTGLQGNLFGIPNTTRHGFGVLGHKKYTEIIESPDGFKGVGTLQVTKDGIPYVSKTLAYEHKFAPAGVKDVLGTDKNPDFKTIKTPKNLGPSFSTRTVESNKTGNLLDRYKTLAYGDIPKSAEVDKKYGGKTEKTEDGGQYHSTKKKGKWIGQGKDISTTDLVYQIDSEGKLGLVKKGADSYMYGTKTGIGEPDKINMHPYGKEDLPAGVDDFIKFKFYDIVNKKHIIFRAFLSGISETFSPEWASEKYIGRPDSVHVYQGVERSMSFEFMIIPSSKQELPILWEKLNYLVGFTYPTWKQMGTTGKRMEAPFMNLTLGDMYNAVPGYLSSLSISVDDNSPWEIDEGFQLPHAINVSCEFTHIGQHALASQGTHYDFGGKDNTWLKPYNAKDGTLGARKQLTDLLGA